MTAIVSMLIAAVVLSGWLYWLTARVQRVLDLAEEVHDGMDRALREPVSTGRHAARPCDTEPFDAIAVDEAAKPVAHARRTSTPREGR